MKHNFSGVSIFLFTALLIACLLPLEHQYWSRGTCTYPWGLHKVVSGSLCAWSSGWSASNILL